MCLSIPVLQQTQLRIVSSWCRCGPSGSDLICSMCLKTQWDICARSVSSCFHVSHSICSFQVYLCCWHRKWRVLQGTLSPSGQRLVSALNTTHLSCSGLNWWRPVFVQSLNILYSQSLSHMLFFHSVKVYRLYKSPLELHLQNNVMVCFQSGFRSVMLTRVGETENESLNYSAAQCL